jgi:hypothetical protein
MSPTGGQLHPETTRCLAPHIRKIRTLVINVPTRHRESLIKIDVTYTKTSMW